MSELEHDIRIVINLLLAANSHYPSDAEAATTAIMSVIKDHVNIQSAIPPRNTEVDA